VHLFGLAADMDAILAIAANRGLQVIEDTAQAFGGHYRGRKLGTLGDAGTFSFFPSKNLGGCGDGGLIVTNNDDVAKQARMLRAHGSRQKSCNEQIGYNSRLDEIQAAILRVKLPHVDRWNQQRRDAAAGYQAGLSDVPWLTLPTDTSAADHVFHQFVVRASRRDELRQSLAERGIATAVYYPRPLHLQPCFGDLGYGQGQLPAAELAARQVVALPMSPGLPADQLTRISETIVRFLYEERPAV
jgi:dTDP-4-amino-4,6-dideoxygalactose transaminase